MAAVECFINSVDSQMRQREEKQKLAAIAGRIEAYESVEGASEEVERVRHWGFPMSFIWDLVSWVYFVIYWKNKLQLHYLLDVSIIIHHALILQILREYNNFDLTAPVMGAPPEETRQLLLEGALKMKEGKESRVRFLVFIS